MERSALYADELPGSVLMLSEEYLDGEVAFWDAGEPDDAAELPDDGSCDWGWWVPVVHPVKGTTWAAAPEALREQLVGLDLEGGDYFEVTDVTRGDDDHDPYNLTVHEAEPDGRPAE